MDIEKCLVMVRNKASGVFVDRTMSVESVRRDGDRWFVTFGGNGKAYSYRLDNVRFYDEVDVISANRFSVFVDGVLLDDVIGILYFMDYFRIIFRGGKDEVYEASVITVEESPFAQKSARAVFDYLYDLSDVVGLKLDDGSSMLRRAYDQIRSVDPRSVLARYLGAKPVKEKEREGHRILYPFGFNASQKEATMKAMVHPISVIEGPPGTGKTQTILNIIANAMIRNESVAVVSNNNSATMNVLEKLEKDGLDFIAAFLGSNKNRETFLERQNSVYPDLASWELTDEMMDEIDKRLVVEHKQLDKMLTYQRKQAHFKKELQTVKLENEYFSEYAAFTSSEDIPFHPKKQLCADDVMAILVDYEQSHARFTFFKKLSYILKYRLFSFKWLTFEADVLVAFLQQLFYTLKIAELTQDIEDLHKQLEDYHFQDKMKWYSDESMRLFKSKLAKRYATSTVREKFSKSAFNQDFSRFIREYPIVLSTTHSLRNCIGKGHMFDYVLIDEASQVDLVTGGLALSVAKKVVVVGDDKQLPNVVTKEDVNRTDAVFRKHDVPYAYHYAENSLLTSILLTINDVPKTLLQEHYRCHPRIIGFCNEKFYDGNLIVLTDEKEHDQPLVVHKTVKGNHARGTMNQREIDVISKEVLTDLDLDVEKDSIGIVSPYRKQVVTANKLKGDLDIEVDTVHKYQGREKDVIILTTVVNDLEKNDFVDDANLINVAVSRAVKKLIIVTSHQSESWASTNIGDLISYIQYNNYEITDSKIYSVFDYLYKCYADELEAFLQANHQVSEFASENLMYSQIQHVLVTNNYTGLDIIVHQPLRMLIKESSLLTEEEWSYARQLGTHTDFVIFNKMNKKPVLVIEVDGHEFHAANEEQLKRDRLKDSILTKYDISFLRFATTGSSEEERLTEKLEEIMG